MPKKKKIGKCVYCLTDGIEVTKEHVVPESFFPEVPSGELPKIPACYSCNNGKSKNDAYLREILAADLGASGSIEAKNLLEGRISRSVIKKYSQLSREAKKSGVADPQFSDGGIYLGEAYSVPVNQESLEKSLSLMTRGIFYFLTKNYLPTDQKFQVRKLRASEFHDLWAKFEDNCSGNGFGWGGTCSGHLCYQENPPIVWMVLVFYQGVPVSIKSIPADHDFNTLEPTKSLIAL